MGRPRRAGRGAEGGEVVGRVGGRADTTRSLSEMALKKLRRQCSLVASEVRLDDSCRVDFVGFVEGRGFGPAAVERGTFVFVEVKSCMDDFTSGHGLTLQGDVNWLVCPRELAAQLYRQQRLPLECRVLCPTPDGRLLPEYETGTGDSQRVMPSGELLYRMATASDQAYRTTREVFRND